MSLDFLSGELTEWQRSALNSTGPVLSTHLSLLRNICPYRFPSMMDGDERKNLYQKLQSEIHQKTDFSEILLNRLSYQEKVVLNERFFMDNLRKEDYPLFIDRSRNLRMQLFRENHIRIETNCSFRDMKRGMDELLLVSEVIERELPVSKDNQFGYHTASLIHSGLGMDCSMILHLPALVTEGYMKNIEETALAGHFLLEKSGTREDLYSLRNISAVYDSPALLLEAFTGMADQICREECRLRSLYITSGHSALEDQSFRALGTLRYNRMISREEAEQALMMVRFGIQMKWINGISPDLLTLLYYLMGDGHIKKIISIEKTVPVDDNLINLYRGELLRRALKK